jgi:hypothetical protein
LSEFLLSWELYKSPQLIAIIILYYLKSDNDNTWKPQQPIVWDPDTPQRKPLSQPAKLWEPKTGKFKIVETTESQSHRSSNIHAWASPQQEVNKSQQHPPSFPGQQPEQQTTTSQSPGQTASQQFNQFMIPNDWLLWFPCVIIVRFPFLRRIFRFP